jgi:hypothetical protein
MIFILLGVDYAVVYVRMRETGTRMRTYKCRLDEMSPMSYYSSSMFSCKSAPITKDDGLANQEMAWRVICRHKLPNLGLWWLVWRGYRTPTTDNHPRCAWWSSLEKWCFHCAICFTGQGKVSELQKGSNDHTRVQLQC